MIHAACLSRVAETNLLVRRKEQAADVAVKGITILQPDGQRTVDRVNATSNPTCLANAELVIVAVKSYSTNEVASVMASHLGQDAVILSLQNGLAHEQAFRDACGAAKVISGKTGYSGRRQADSTVEMAATGVTVIGEPAATLTERIVTISKLFGDAGINVNVSDNIRAEVWSKFAQACCQNALSALTRKSFGNLRRSEEATELLRRGSAELTALADAEGVRLLFDPYERIMDNWLFEDHRSSMLQDLESDRPTEVDALNGEAVRLGKGHGLSMPINETLWLLTKASESM